MKQASDWSRNCLLGCLLMCLASACALGQDHPVPPYRAGPGFAIGTESRRDRVDRLVFSRNATVAEWVTSGNRWFVFSYSPPMIYRGPVMNSDRGAFGLKAANHAELRLGRQYRIELGGLFTDKLGMARYSFFYEEPSEFDIQYDPLLHHIGSGDYVGTPHLIVRQKRLRMLSISAAPHFTFGFVRIEPYYSMGMGLAEYELVTLEGIELSPADKAAYWNKAGRSDVSADIFGVRLMFVF